MAWRACSNPAPYLHPQLHPFPLWTSVTDLRWPCLVTKPSCFLPPGLDTCCTFCLTAPSLSLPCPRSSLRPGLSEMSALPPTTLPGAAPPPGRHQLITVFSFCHSTFPSLRSFANDCHLPIGCLSPPDSEQLEVRGHLCLVVTVSWPLGQ